MIDTGAAKPPDVDVAVVGAGIVGLAAARELLRRRPGLRIVVLEREAQVGAHQTSHNSGVVHAGIYYAPGSLKARLCVEGSLALARFCEQHDIPLRHCGKLIVATTAAELPGLAELERRGQANGVPGLRRLGAQEIVEVEPHATGIAALHSPQTGVVDFLAVARALADDLRAKGVEIRTGCAVQGVSATGRGTGLVTPAGEVRARFALFCAGAWADRLAVAAGARADPRIVPFRGAWLRLVPERRDLVRGMIYPVPDPELPFLGVHLTRGIDDEVLVGPTALLVASRTAYRLRDVNRHDLADTLTWPGTARMAARWWRTALTELTHAVRPATFARDAARYVPALRPDDLRPGPSGVRAQALGRDGALVDDFVFSPTEGALHVRNAPSPAATSAFAIASEIADRVEPALG